MVKNPPANAEDAGLISRSGRSPREGIWQLTPVFLPGETHGQWSLEGYSPLDCKAVGHDLAIKQQQKTLENMKKIILFVYLIKYISFLEGPKAGSLKKYYLE